MIELMLGQLQNSKYYGGNNLFHSNGGLKFYDYILLKGIIDSTKTEDIAIVRTVR